MSTQPTATCTQTAASVKSWVVDIADQRTASTVYLYLEGPS